MSASEQNAAGVPRSDVSFIIYVTYAILYMLLYTLSFSLYLLEWGCQLQVA